MKKSRCSSYVVCVVGIMVASVLLLSGCSEEDNAFAFSDDNNLMSIELPPEFADVEINKDEQSFQTSAGEKTMEWYQAVGQDSLYMIGIVDVGFPPREMEDMIQGLEYGRMNYSYNGKVISEGQTESKDRIFVTGRYSFDQGGNTLYHEVALTHVGNWQFILQVLGVDEATLEREEARNFFSSFAYTGPDQESGEGSVDTAEE